jgi:hypothetical protein
MRRKKVAPKYTWERVGKYGNALVMLLKTAQDSGGIKREVPFIPDADYKTIRADLEQGIAWSHYGEHGSLHSVDEMVEMNDGKVLVCIAAGKFTDTFHSGETVVAWYIGTPIGEPK